jgi:hypothetical protein
MSGTFHMDAAGKYWFDRKWEADVVLESYKINPETHSIEAEYVGRNFVDKTNYSPLARFLRWVLRR